MLIICPNKTERHRCGQNQEKGINNKNEDFYSYYYYFFFLQGFPVLVQAEVLISFVSNKHFYCLKYHFKTLIYDNTSTVAFQEKKILQISTAFLISSFLLSTHILFKITLEALRKCSSLSLT